MYCQSFRLKQAAETGETKNVNMFVGYIEFNC